MALFVKPDFLSFLLHHGRQIFLGPMYFSFQQFLRMWIISSSHTSPVKRIEYENFTTHGLWVVMGGCAVDSTFNTFIDYFLLSLKWLSMAGKLKVKFD